MPTLKRQMFTHLVRQPNTTANVSAIVMWELLTGQEPYEQMKIYEIPQAVVDGKRPPIPRVSIYLKTQDNWNNQKREEEYISLMCKAWSPKPEDRPTMAEIAASLTTMCTKY